MICFLKKFIVVISQGIDGIFFNILKLRFIVEEKEDTSINSIKVGLKEEFSDSDSIEGL